jgi:hypothetical protein
MSLSQNSKYRQFLNTQPNKVDWEFEKAVEQIPRPASVSKPGRKKKGD